MVNKQNSLTNKQLNFQQYGMLNTKQLLYVINIQVWIMNSEQSSDTKFDQYNKQYAKF